MDFDFNQVRPGWHLPPYPPYHKGLYLEEYFFEFYKQHKEEFDKTGRTLIPIFWTSCYMRNMNVQLFVNALPKDKKYFAVAQHDDAIREELPPGTIPFCAGGNSPGVPIPLVCSPLPIQSHYEVDKDIMCSFVGSLTHPIREKLQSKWNHVPGFLFATSEWSINVEAAKLQYFVDVTRRSKFALAPRGYGAQSFRFYEIMQLGTVPVYVHNDEVWCPFSGLVDWNKFAVVIHESEVDKLEDILKSIDEVKYQEMLEYGKEVYQQYFTLEAVCQQILKTLQTIA